MRGFFPNRERTELLETRILPELLSQQRQAEPLRLWFAGCGSGEELYSLIILVRERLQKLTWNIPVQVFATDTDEHLLASARSGSYPASAFARVSDERLRSFFTSTAGGYRVNRELRDNVIFMQHNPVSDPPFSYLHLLCLPAAPEPAFQDKIINLCHFALTPGGTLLLRDSSNVIKEHTLFEPVDGHRNWYRRLSGRTNMLMLAPWAPAYRASAGSRQAQYQQNIYIENDEYRSLCEELQSYKEELTSQTEELTAQTEELTMFNQQLREQIEVQELANNDLLNLLASIRIATLFLGGQLNIRRFTPEAKEIFHLIDDDIGRPITDIAARVSDVRFIDDIKTVVRQPLRIREHELRADDGRWYLRRVQPYLTQDEQIDGAVITWIDITKAKKAELNAHHQAHHDALTGLANRRELEHRLLRILETARRTESEHALMFLDLDQFKMINDSCGHAAGDELLRQLALLLVGKVRERDMVARLGGDEFAVLLEHCTLTQAQQIGENLRKAVEEFVFTSEKQSFTIGASIGLVSLTGASGSPEDVMKAADAACYSAKESGRNRLQIYHEKDSVLVKRRGEVKWLAQIRRALQENRFRLYSQKIVALQENADEELHYELLIRLLDDQDQPVTPENFLGAVERYNLAPCLDRWVAQHAIEWLLARPQHLHDLKLCNINLSAQSLNDETFLSFLHGQLKNNSRLGTKLCFEITETAAIGNIARAIRFIHEIRCYGCRFALDDFGSGLASFVHLKTLPVDFLKIDGMLVRDIASDPVDREMIRCIHGMARATGKQTIAEFAESGTIMQILRDIGVDYAQGYAIGYPQPLLTSLEAVV